MAEDDERATSARPDAAVLGAALAQADSADARDYLRAQTKLADLQSDDLLREDKLRHWSLRVRHISDVLKLGFELAVAFIVLALAFGIGAAIWQAAHADGLVIQSFNVPAPMTDKGLTGQVIADKLLDHLTIMQDGTDSSRAASSFANDWSNDIKVEIPDTGVSLGEAVRFLHGWLGHEMHLSGELYETPAGIALTVRLDNEPGQTFEGKAEDLNGVIARAAEAVYARAQPYRFGVYLSQRGRVAEAEAAFRKLAAAGPPTETAWADVGLSFISMGKGDVRAALADVEAGEQAEPDLPNFAFVLGGIDSQLGHDEQALADLRRSFALLKGSGARQWDPATIAASLKSGESFQAQARGDYAQALANAVQAAGSGGAEPVAVQLVFIAVSMHDLAATRRFLTGLDALRADSDPRKTAIMDAAAMHGLLSLEERDWRGAVAHFEEAPAVARAAEASSKGWWNADLNLRTNVLAPLAYAQAMAGAFDKADAILKTLPDDCDICARMHGRVAAARRNWGAAAHWFALVSARSPSVPFADTDWGQMLMAKGDLDGAIAKFEAANRKGPQFADALELWGEALMLGNRSDLALAKFEEAGKDAPNWGRLHLKWGEALGYAGRGNEAKAQFAIAAGLDPSVADKAELARAMHG